MKNSARSAVLALAAALAATSAFPQSQATSGQIAGFIAESIQGVGGSVVFPDGYLKHAYEHVRAAGGVGGPSTPKVVRFPA